MLLFHLHASLRAQRTRPAFPAPSDRRDKDLANTRANLVARTRSHALRAEAELPTECEIQNTARRRHDDFERLPQTVSGWLVVEWRRASIPAAHNEDCASKHCPGCCPNRLAVASRSRRCSHSSADSGSWSLSKHRCRFFCEIGPISGRILSRQRRKPQPQLGPPISQDVRRMEPEPG
jgi:hypothetical protein